MRAPQTLVREWSNAHFNFDHLGNAMTTLFVVATLNGYQEVMDNGEQGGGAQLQGACRAATAARNQGPAAAYSGFAIGRMALQEEQPCQQRLASALPPLPPPHTPLHT